MNFPFGTRYNHFLFDGRSLIVMRGNLSKRGRFSTYKTLHRIYIEMCNFFKEATINAPISPSLNELSLQNFSLEVDASKTKRFKNVQTNHDVHHIYNTGK